MGHSPTDSPSSISDDSVIALVPAGFTVPEESSDSDNEPSPKSSPKTGIPARLPQYSGANSPRSPPSKAPLFASPSPVAREPPKLAYASLAPGDKPKCSSIKVNLTPALESTTNARKKATFTFRAGPGDITINNDGGDPKVKAIPRFYFTTDSGVPSNDQTIDHWLLTDGASTGNSTLISPRNKECESILASSPDLWPADPAAESKDTGTHPERPATLTNSPNIFNPPQRHAERQRQRSDQPSEQDVQHPDSPSPLAGPQLMPPPGYTRRILPTRKSRNERSEALALEGATSQPSRTSSQPSSTQSTQFAAKVPINLESIPDTANQKEEDAQDPCGHKVNTKTVQLAESSYWNKPTFVDEGHKAPIPNIRDQSPSDYLSEAESALESLLQLEYFQGVQSPIDRLSLLLDLLRREVLRQPLKTIQNYLKQQVPGGQHASSLTVNLDNAYSAEDREIDLQGTRTRGTHLAGDGGLQGGKTTLSLQQPPATSDEISIVVNTPTSPVESNHGFPVPVAVQFNPNVQIKNPDGTFNPKNIRPYYALTVQDHLMRTVQNKLSLRESNKVSDGKIYLYWVASDLGLVKIGKTKHDDLSKRMRQWKNKCKRTPIPIELDEDCRGTFPHAFRIEALVHAEFRDQRVREENCSECGGNHLEWMRVSEKLAKQVTRKWCLWMKQRPYEKTGTQKVRGRGKDRGKWVDRDVWELKQEFVDRLKKDCEPTVEQSDDTAARRLSNQRSRVSSRRPTSADRRLSVKHGHYLRSLSTSALPPTNSL